jgi:hypothetical protein
VEELLDTASVWPPDPALPPRTIVPVAAPPAVAGFGLKVTFDTACDPLGRIVKTSLPVWLPVDAEIVACCIDVTKAVGTSNCAVVCPAGIVICCTARAVEFETLRLTGVPPDGAGAPRTTVPVEKLPPVTVVGDIVTWTVGLPSAPVEDGVMTKFPVAPPSVDTVVTVG